MEKYSNIIIGLTLAAMALAVWYGSSSKGSDYDVKIETAQAMWEKGEVVIIDVRTEGEYQEGHIPGTVNIPLDQLEKRQVEVARTEKVLLICRTGSRSSSGTKLLRSKDFANVYNMTGGMKAWRGPVTR